MAKEYEFTSGQIWAVQNIFGTVPPASYAAMPRHLSIRAMFQFTAEEQEAINWQEEVGPPGQADRTTFNDGVALTRRLTSGQRKKIAEVVRQGASQFQPAWYERWILPVLETIGFPLAEADWDDEDECEGSCEHDH